MTMFTENQVIAFLRVRELFHKKTVPLPLEMSGEDLLYICHPIGSSGWRMFFYLYNIQISKNLMGKCTVNINVFSE